MTTKKLSKRLRACMTALKHCKTIADIGTDHAYLPCWGIKEGVFERAIAIDVIDGPLVQAKKTIASFGLTEKIDLRKGSGLSPLKPGEVDGFLMAGMGGSLMRKLLLADLSIAKSMKYLVFVPQEGEPKLRRTLYEQQLMIIDEQLIACGGIIYTIIVAQPAKKAQVATEQDILLGPILRMLPQAALFVQKWTHELDALARLFEQIPPGNPKRQNVAHQMDIIKEALASDDS